MLGRLVLIALQLGIGWFATPEILRYIRIGGDVQMFVEGAAAAVIVWVVGLVGAQALKEVSTPSPATLVWALIGGLIGAAIVVFKIPGMLQLPFSVPALMWPLGLAIVGYAIKR
jgi:uncharacterized membrane protein YdcZ (DUF606 family)